MIRSPAAYRHAWYTVPVFLYAGIIFSLSSVPNPPVVLLPGFNVDKLLHFMEYMVFGYLIMRMLMTSPQVLRLHRAALITIAAGTVFGGLDEFYQSFVPGRDASAYDVLADGCGIAAAAFSYRIVRYKIAVLRILEESIEKGSFHGK